MVEDSEYLSVLVQISFQLTNTVHPKLKQLELKSCVAVGVSNAQVEGIPYDKESLPSDWYIQYKYLASIDTPQNKTRNFFVSDVRVRILPDRSSIPKTIFMPQKHVLPAIPESEQSSTSGHKYFSRNVYSHPSIETTVYIPSDQLYIPKENPFLAINNMFRTYVSNFSPVEEFQYANHRYVKGGKWLPKTKFCTSSSQSKQPPTRADCAPLLEHNSQNPNDLD